MRLTRRLAAASVLSALPACAEVLQRSVPADADRFARGYIVALHDSSAAVVIARTKPSTAALPAFADGIGKMRSILPAGPLDTLELREFEVLRETGKPPTTRLLYTVRGRASRAEAELWIEEPKDGARTVETVRIAPLGS